MDNTNKISKLINESDAHAVGVVGMIIRNADTLEKESEVTEFNIINNWGRDIVTRGRGTVGNNIYISSLKSSPSKGASYLQDSIVGQVRAGISTPRVNFSEGQGHMYAEWEMRFVQPQQERVINTVGLGNDSKGIRCYVSLSEPCIQGTNQILDVYYRIYVPVDESKGRTAHAAKVILSRLSHATNGLDYTNDWTSPGTHSRNYSEQKINPRKIIPSWSSDDVQNKVDVTLNHHIDFHSEITHTGYDYDWYTGVNTLSSRIERSSETLACRASLGKIFGMANLSSLEDFSIDDRAYVFASTIVENDYSKYIQPPFYHSYRATSPFQDIQNLSEGLGTVSFSGIWNAGKIPEYNNISIVKSGSVGDSEYTFAKRKFLGFNGASYDNRVVTSPVLAYSKEGNIASFKGSVMPYDYDSGTFIGFLNTIRMKNYEVLRFNKKGLSIASVKDQTNRFYSKQSTPSLPCENISDVTVDNAGNIWVADRESGLYKIDEVNNTITRMGMSDPLIVDTICLGVKSSKNDTIVALFNKGIAITSDYGLSWKKHNAVSSEPYDPSQIAEVDNSKEYVLSIDPRTTASKVRVWVGIFSKGFVDGYINSIWWSPERGSVQGYTSSGWYLNKYTSREEIWSPNGQYLAMPFNVNSSYQRYFSFGSSLYSLEIESRGIHAGWESVGNTDYPILYRSPGLSTIFDPGWQHHTENSNLHTFKGNYSGYSSSNYDWNSSRDDTYSTLASPWMFMLDEEGNETCIAISNSTYIAAINKVEGSKYSVTSHGVWDNYGWNQSSLQWEKGYFGQSPENLNGDLTLNRVNMKKASWELDAKVSSSLVVDELIERGVGGISFTYNTSYIPDGEDKTLVAIAFPNLEFGINDSKFYLKTVTERFELQDSRPLDVADHRIFLRFNFNSSVDVFVDGILKGSFNLHYINTSIVKGIKFGASISGNFNNNLNGEIRNISILSYNACNLEDQHVVKDFNDSNTSASYNLSSLGQVNRGFKISGLSQTENSDFDESTGVFKYIKNRSDSNTLFEVRRIGVSGDLDISFKIKSVGTSLAKHAHDIAVSLSNPFQGYNGAFYSQSRSPFMLFLKSDGLHILEFAEEGDSSEKIVPAGTNDTISIRRLGSGSLELYVNSSFVHTIDMVVDSNTALFLRTNNSSASYDRIVEFTNINNVVDYSKELIGHFPTNDLITDNGAKATSNVPEPIVGGVEVKFSAATEGDKHFEEGDFITFATCKGFLKDNIRDLNLKMKVYNKSPDIGITDASHSAIVSTNTDVSDRWGDVPTAYIDNSILLGSSGNNTGVYDPKFNEIDPDTLSVELNGVLIDHFDGPNDPSEWMFVYGNEYNNLDKISGDRIYLGTNTSGINFYRNVGSKILLQKENGKFEEHSVTNTYDSYREIALNPNISDLNKTYAGATMFDPEDNIIPPPGQYRLIKKLGLLIFNPNDVGKSVLVRYDTLRQ